MLGSITALAFLVSTRFITASINLAICVIQSCMAIDFSQEIQFVCCRGARYLFSRGLACGMLQ